MKKKLLVLIPIIIIMLVAGYIIYNKNKYTPAERYFRVNLYETYEYYCDCIDSCDCPNGPKLYKTFTVREGEKIIKPDDLSQEGRTFLGWAIGSELSTELFDFNNPITQDLELYAKWETSNRHKVTFHEVYENYCNCYDCGCPTGPRVHTVLYVNDGELVTEPDAPKGKENALVGWTLEENGQELFDFNTPITSDLNLYTKWK